MIENTDHRTCQSGNNLTHDGRGLCQREATKKVKVTGTGTAVGTYAMCSGCASHWAILAPRMVTVLDGEEAMTENTTNADPAWRKKIAAVLRSWKQWGWIGPAWSLEFDTTDGCFRVTYTLLATWDEHPRTYSLTDAEFCQRLIGLADMCPYNMGEAALALADEAREESS